MKLAFNFLAYANAVICPAWLAFYSDLTWVKVVLFASSAVGIIHCWQWLRVTTKDREIIPLP